MWPNLNLNKNSILVVQDLTCWRGEQLLFQELNFEIKAGQALELIGHNGIGKSSLLAILAGFLCPQNGTITLNGLKLTAQDVFWLGIQAPYYPQEKLYDNLLLWAVLNNFSDHAVMNALKKYYLIQQMDLPVSALSRGQLQRAQLARLHFTRAPIWLLDEPLAGLDEAGQDIFFEDAENFKKQGGIIIIAPSAKLIASLSLVIENFKPKKSAPKRSL